jgi:hypothetical protein
MYLNQNKEKLPATMEMVFHTHHTGSLSVYPMKMMVSLKSLGWSTGWYSTFGEVTQWPGVWFLRVGKPPISLELQMAWGFQPPTLRIQGQSQVALNWYVCMQLYAYMCIYIYIIGKYVYIYITLHCITLILRTTFTFTFTFTFTLFTYIHDCCPSCKSLLVGSSTQ